MATTLTEQILQGQDLYSVNCVECHGGDGEGGIVQGVEGLEGFNMKAIHSQDEMYTRTDDTFADIVSYGQPNLGMQPFGKAYGGVLSPSEIDSLVAFMRYTWDDRAEIPPGAVSTIPTLNAGEVPSWDVHILPLVKRYCVSCHRAGRQNNNYLMTSYQEMLSTGDNAPLITAGDPQSLLIKLINGQEGLDPLTGKVIRQMPPTKLIDQQYIDMLTNWIMNGMPQTADEAGKIQATPLPGLAVNLTGDPVAGLVVFTGQCVQCHGVDGAQGVENPGSADGTVPVLNPIDPEIKGTDLKAFVLNLDIFIQNGSIPAGLTPAVTPPVGTPPPGTTPVGTPAAGAAPKLSMPAFGIKNFITQQQIADVIAYIISLNK